MTLRLNQLSETGNCVKCSDCRCKEVIIFVQRTEIYNLVFGLWTSSSSAPLWLMKKAGGILKQIKNLLPLCEWSTRIWALKFGIEIVLNEDVEFFLEEFRCFLKISCSGCVVHFPYAHIHACTLHCSNCTREGLLLHVRWIKEMLPTASLLIF